ncbi:unnamed protein product [Rhizoctonia solani]|uniref:BTB domain-containing protein n=1 Tax=Rhizoctonia solani TaxID=456999 RepID=A0A8H2XYY1_9AGAM|nr:unnamed protein product [Rhizoctonia solani]
MSGPENSTNNQYPPSSNPFHQPRFYVRDSTFHHRNGDAFFLVGNTEFKLHASLLDAEVRRYEFEEIMKGAGNDLENNTSTSVDIPRTIILPGDVAPDEFRDLLMVTFGGVKNEAFLDLIATLQKPSSCSPHTVARLINIGYLACRFGMLELDTWSQTQIHAILEQLFLLPRPRKDGWGTQTILRFVKYMQNTCFSRYRHELLDLMRHILSDLVQGAYELTDEVPQGAIIDICVGLYKEKDILINSPGFFGFIFAVIISLGPQSEVWCNGLTREDRRIFYAAHATFTCLSDHVDLKLGWLADPAAIPEVCTECSLGLKTSWRGAFGRCNGLKSRVPLEDIRHIVALAYYRYHFRSIGRSWDPTRNEFCGCDIKVLGVLEEHIESLYCGLAEKYKSLVKTV